MGNIVNYHDTPVCSESSKPVIKLRKYYQYYFGLYKYFKNNADMRDEILSFFVQLSRCSECYKFLINNTNISYKEMGKIDQILNLKRPLFNPIKKPCDACQKKLGKYSYIKDVEISNTEEIALSLEAFNFGRRLNTLILRNKNAITNIRLQISFPFKFELLKDDFEYALIRSVELQIGSTPVDKIYNHTIYQYYKATKKTIVKDNNSMYLYIDLPLLGINGKNPLYLNTCYDIRLNIETEELNKLVKDNNLQVDKSSIYAFVLVTYCDITHEFDINKQEMINVKQLQCAGEEILSYSKKYLMYTLNYNHPVTELSFQISNTKNTEKYFDYLNAIEKVKLVFNGYDYCEDIKGDDIVQDGNIYKIKFKEPINFSQIDSVRLIGTLKEDILEKYDRSDLIMWISVVGYNKLTYADFGYPDPYCELLWKG
jgi:hypothetical protein